MKKQKFYYLIVRNEDGDNTATHEFDSYDGARKMRDQLKTKEPSHEYILAFAASVDDLFKLFPDYKPNGSLNFVQHSQKAKAS